MKTAIGLLLIIPAIGIMSCKKKNDVANPPTSPVTSTIKYASVNKQYVLTRDLKSIPDKTDEVSRHIDSILTGEISAEFVSTGSKSFDLDSNKENDISFEIIDLQPLNNHNLPASFDSLAVRVSPLTIQVLDNSTHNYADALNVNDIINNKGNWTTQNCVLGTFGDAGQFKGKGEKYLGIRFVGFKSFIYGWIKLYCSQHNDTLRIIEYAFNQQANTEIKAGQKQ